MICRLCTTFLFNAVLVDDKSCKSMFKDVDGMLCNKDCIDMYES